MKKEKYIYLKKNASGNKIIQIQISAYDQTYRQTLNLKHYETEKEAWQVAKNIRDRKLVEMASGYTVSNFKTVKEIFLKSYEVLPVRKKTVDRHKHFYKVGIDKYSNVKIDKITSADIQESINTYSRTHTREQTSHLLAVWRRIYKTAVMLNINIPDRTIPVIVPECKKEEPRKKDISPEDLTIFLETLEEYNSGEIRAAYENKCLYYAIQIMRYTGIRPAECLALSRNDIFITSDKTGYISINKAVHSTIESRNEIGTTKTAKSNRVVPVPADLVQILKECLAWSKYELIFSDYYGNLQDIDKVSDYIRRVARKAGVQFNLYMLRHQLSTDLFSTGINPAVIRDILGHESIDMSLYYAVSKEEEKEKALEKRKFN